MKCEEIPIVEKLTSTTPVEGRPYKSDAVRPVNPDGPEAAAMLKELVEACGPLVLYHASGGHEGDGSDAACERAVAALTRAQVQS